MHLGGLVFAMRNVVLVRASSILLSDARARSLRAGTVHHARLNSHTLP